jgi:hypothetical protein
MNRAELRLKAAFLTAVLLVVVVWVNAGNLTPPGGPVSPTMKDLATVEPRTPIASLPYSINAPGSYYVVRDLTGVSGQHGITINASEVSLDLCGFTLRGTSGSLNGIYIPGAPGSRAKTRIENGIVTGWGGDGLNNQASNKNTIVMFMARDNGGSGVSTDGDTTVLYMQSNNNQGPGLQLGDNGICIDSETTGNGGGGIEAGSGCKIEDCVCADNGADGLLIGEGSVVARCTLSGNAGNGLLASSGPGSKGCNIADCIAVSNTLSGISTAAGGTVSSCTGQSNGLDGIVVLAGCTVSRCTTRNNNNDGIEATADCLLLSNNSSANGVTTPDGAGIHVTSAGGGTRVEANNCVNNDRNFFVESTGNVIVKNTSTGGGVGGLGGSGYYIIITPPPGNAVGAITNVVGNSNFTAGAWANLQF